MAVLSNLMADPSWGTDVGDPLILVAFKVGSDMVEQMVRHAMLPVFDR
ncbi:hypothetical protein [Rhizobium sp. Leaf262]|nr:hypothetical protein [Rhizobium sp. Leaf262]